MMLKQITLNDRARYYDPSSGRFLSEDPIGFAGGDFNLYRYVGNQPVLYSDPAGLQKPGDPNFTEDMRSEGETYSALMQAYLDNLKEEKNNKFNESATIETNNENAIKLKKYLNSCAGKK